MDYLITLHLDNGDEVRARVTADSPEEATARLTASEQYLNFIAGKQVVAIDCTIDPDAEKPANYMLQPSSEQGWWVATDITNGVVVRFKQGAYNDTAKVTLLDDVRDVLAAAGEIRRLADWLATEHPELV